MAHSQMSSPIFYGGHWQGVEHHQLTESNSNMTDYKATYSPDDNKLRLRASERLPKDLYTRVRSAGFIWAPTQKFFVAPAWSPEAEDIAIELAGEIGDEDSSLLDRAEVRAERFEDYSDKRADEAEQRLEALNSNPAYVAGQPIHVGHHSQRRAERDAEKLENDMKKAAKLWDTSKYWTRRAEGAIRHAKYKEVPEVRARRIKTLEAEQRKKQRSRDTFAQLLDLYTNPKNADVTTRDGRNMRRAVLGQLSHGGLSYKDQCALEAGTLSYEEALARAVAHCNTWLAHDDRWIGHLANRLTYEKVMLEDQGASELIAPKARPKQLPLCNYRAPEGVTVPNPYERGKMETYKQLEMTSAEYARIRAENKGTRIVDRSHRVRVAIIPRKGEAHYMTDRVCVFLTDSKVHKRPAPGPEREAAAEPRLYETRLYVAPEPTAFDALKESLRQGVKAVSAPQLFVTSPAMAAEIVQSVDIKPHHRVLDPSAGTGNLLRAILARQPAASCVAVEISNPLARTLATQFPTVTVREANFLECNGDLGKFDVIIMNPPFAKGQDIKHAQHALQMLNPGGQFRAIMSAGVTFRQDAAEFRAQIEERGGSIEDQPEGSFQESGTNVRTVLVTLNA